MNKASASKTRDIKRRASAPLTTPTDLAPRAVRDVATASLIENWIDESKRRTWSLFEAIRNRG